MTNHLRYQSGFGNYFETEAVVGTLPIARNNPQKAPFSLYAEQLNGSAFTEPRAANHKAWLYRIQPSVSQGNFLPYDQAPTWAYDVVNPVPPNQMRWDPLPFPKSKTTFLQGLHTVAVNGSIAFRAGSAIHLYVANTSMDTDYFYNADGDFLVVPQLGRILFKTEFGNLEVGPGEIVVIPRGIKFQTHLLEKEARGYICENFGANFVLPERGPIGANALANDRDFLVPVAAYEERRGDFQLVTKFQGRLWSAELDHSPLDVVAWHGNYVPYKYDLKSFCTINTVSYDHPDPSIFTVLTSQTVKPGVANVDFVIFPERWMVAENTFRPPYYHRNIMSEYMGLIHGVYDAKEKGFVPGGGSLHNCMSAHGPEADVFEKASSADLKPMRYQDTLAFMFESSLVYQPTRFALESEILQKDYMDCWKGLKRNFKNRFFELKESL